MKNLVFTNVTGNCVQMLLQVYHYIEVAWLGDLQAQKLNDSFLDEIVGTIPIFKNGEIAIKNISCNTYHPCLNFPSLHVG